MPEPQIRTRPSNGSNNTKMKFVKIFFTIIPFIFFCSQVFAEHKPLRVAVASNFAPVLEKLLPSFSADTGIEVQLIKGATGTLYQQIKHGAPFDIFMAADAVRPEKLSKENK